MSGWVKIRSWHIQSGLVSRGGMVHTLCGRWAPAIAIQAPALPSGEKSCEACFRLREVALAPDQPATPGDEPLR